MEVHHHLHTSSLPAGRAGKKWTHYFWEFLMLFFAVNIAEERKKSAQRLSDLIKQKYHLK